MEEIVYLNGSFLPPSKAHLSISDHGFLYGYGLFQTIRAYNSKLFLLDRHIKRLLEAAEVIGLGEKLKGIDFEKACRETVTANKLESARVRLTVTNGDSDALPWVDAGGAPTVLVTAKLYSPFPEQKYKEGFRVGIASVKRTRQSVLSTMKSTNYLMNVVARMEAAQKGLDEALLLNDGGYIAEGGGGNVFFVEKNKLVTPPVESGIIPGITREVIMETAAGLGLSVTERDIKPDELGNFKEAFMTNAMIEVMPLVAVRNENGQEITIGSGKPGAVTRKLMAAYKAKVELETA